VQPNNGYAAADVEGFITFNLPATPSVLDRYIFIANNNNTFQVQVNTVGGYIGWNGTTGTNLQAGTPFASCTLICAALGVFFLESSNIDFWFLM